MKHFDELFALLSKKNLSDTDVNKIVDLGLVLASILGNNEEVLVALEKLKKQAEAKKQEKDIEVIDEKVNEANKGKVVLGNKKYSDKILNWAYDEVAKRLVKLDLDKCSDDEKAKIGIEILVAIKEFQLDDKELTQRVNEQFDIRIEKLRSGNKFLYQKMAEVDKESEELIRRLEKDIKEANLVLEKDIKEANLSLDREFAEFKRGKDEEQKESKYPLEEKLKESKRDTEKSELSLSDEDIEKYRKCKTPEEKDKFHYEKDCEKLADLLKRSLLGEENRDELHLRYNIIETRRKRMGIEANEIGRETKKPKSKVVDEVDSVRPTFAEVGKKSESKGFWEKIKDRIEIKKIDNLYYKGLNPTADWGHVKTLDYNRYPHMRTSMSDFTNIDHVVFPDPSKNRRLNLAGSKLKDKLNLSAYDSVNLMEADLSKVTELDLSHCKYVDLTNVDLSHLKSLKLPKEGRISLRGTKLPPMDTLDLSIYKEAILNGADMGKINTVIMPEVARCSGKMVFPKHIDASESIELDISGVNMDLSKVETIEPPQCSKSGHASKFVMVDCNVPNLKNLDVSLTETALVSGCTFSSLESLKIKATEGEDLINNSAPNIKKIDVEAFPTSHSSMRETRKMFDTYKNICTAITLGQTVYKDVEKGKLCPITENQKEAVKFIEKSWEIRSLWSDMSNDCNHIKDVSVRHGIHNDKDKKEVFTYYNKVLSQALGIPRYINFETLQYEETPPLSSGEKINLPKLEISHAGFIKFPLMAKQIKNEDGGRKGEQPSLNINRNNGMQI